MTSLAPVCECLRPAASRRPASVLFWAGVCACLWACLGLAGPSVHAQPAPVGGASPAQGASPGQAPQPQTRSQTRPGGPIPPLRLAGLATGAGAGILRVGTVRGEVLQNKGPRGPGAPMPVDTNTVLAVRDEISTKAGASVELITAAGPILKLGEGSLLALLGPAAMYLARGELQIVNPSAGQPGQPLPGLVIATPCGRTPFKVRDARLKVDGTSAVISVYDGTAFLNGYPPAGVPILAGQTTRCTKGEPLAPPHPLIAAPVWTGGSELVLVGDGGSPTEVTLRWQPVPGAQRYRVELFRAENEAEPTPVTTTDALPGRPQVEFRELEVGSYLARVSAFDENGAISQEGQPHRFLLSRIAGLGLDGTIRIEAGQMPRISTPSGLQSSVLLDGTVPAPGMPGPGAHKLRVMVAGLSAEVPMVVTGQLPAQSGQTAEQTPEQPAQPTDTSSQTAEATPQPAEQTPPAEPAQPPLGEATANAKPGPVTPTGGVLEDVLLGGVGEVPFDGIRSPWAGKMLGLRLETTISGSMRAVLAGRWTAQNGFGIDVSAAILRAALSSRPDGEGVAGFGNINAGLRTPALRTRHVALQGVLGLVIPVSTSFLDTSIETDPQYVDPATGSPLKPDVRSRGGGWRLEPALLFGVRMRHITLSTMQGVSLRLAPDFTAAYAGGLILQADIVPSLHFISFATWQVNYLATIVSPGDSTPDAGGAFGGGLEGLIPAGKRGSVRLAVLGRVGLGDAGAAIYGRGAIGLQLGYLFK